MTASAPPTASVLSSTVQSQLLLGVPGIRHGITSRMPGLGSADGNVAYSPPRDQADAWEMRRLWCTALALDPEDIVTAGQIHGAIVLQTGEQDRGFGARPGSGRLGLGDVLMTSAPGPALLTLHADCLPLFLVDPDLPAVAAVHAGWRGTLADVAGAAVGAMSARFGSRPDRLLAFLGPAICRECYEVGDEVAAGWETTAGASAAAAIDRTTTRWQFDLKVANALLLERAGVCQAHMEISNICTRCDGDRWFSHRGQGPETGRFGALIAITVA